MTIPADPDVTNAGIEDTEPAERHYVGRCQDCWRDLYSDNVIHHCESCTRLLCEPCGDSESECDICRPTYVGDCCDCGDSLYDHYDYSYCDECDERHCGGCDCECDDENEHVHNYSWTPDRWNPKGDYPAAPLLGVELEVGGPADDIVSAVHAIDCREHHLYMKEDGSISGVEIVSHPATLEWVNEWNAGGNGWAGVLRHLQATRSVTVADGYGLHVHVSRNAFRRNGRRSAHHAMAWLMFIYRNADAMKDIARRTDNQWCAFTDQRPGELANKAKTDGYGGARYVAVNCNNSRTFELRFFAATLDVTEFMAALELATATVEYTRALRSADVLHGNALDWHVFASWVAGRDEYPNLAAEIARIDRDAGVCHYPRGMFAYDYQRGANFHETHRYNVRHYHY